MKGGAPSNWGSSDPVYMQRNAQYFDLIMGAYVLWSHTYDDPDRPRAEYETFRECFHRKYGNGAEGEYIEVTHTTDHRIPYRSFWCGIFIDPETYLLGRYRLRYTDGEEVFFDVVYGENISSSSLACAFGEDGAEFDPDRLFESALYEISYSTLPSVIDGETCYTTRFKNPHPEKEIADVTYLPLQNVTVRIKKIEKT